MAPFHSFEEKNNFFYILCLIQVLTQNMLFELLKILKFFYIVFIYSSGNNVALRLCF